MRRKIDEFSDSFHQLFPNLDSEIINLKEIPYGDEDLEQEDEDDLVIVPRGDIEKTDIFLPSTCPGILPRQLQNAADVEMTLRISQADNALEIIRREIGHKSFLFRNEIALSTNKQMKTRGYAAVKSSDQELRKYVRIYNQARNAMLVLGGRPEIVSRYEKLTREQLLPLKSIYEPNARGQGKYSLPWFWTLQVASDCDSSEYMDECMSSYFSKSPYSDRCSVPS